MILMSSRAYCSLERSVDCVANAYVLDPNPDRRRRNPECDLLSLFTK
jgi:hypothetical protein